jgi:predicted DNA-binding transcriptional regulator AlpA
MTTSNAILRPPQASRYLGLSTSFLAKKRLTGDGPKFIRLSARAIGYHQSDLDAWLKQKLCSSTSEYGALEAPAPPK